jgi:S1-C subfamily serine protease
VITEVDGREVRDPDDVADAIKGLEPGDEVEVEAESSGITQNFDVELEARPQRGP